MNVIMANKYYYERGGADRYALDLSYLLENHGHNVIPFAMQHPKNLPTPWERFFPSEVQTERPMLNLEGLKTFRRMIYSREAKIKMTELIAEARPDICHVHNIYTQLSPSVLDVLEEKQVPTVMTVHDYHLIAPNYMLWSRGKIEDWGDKGLITASLSRYHKNSMPASFAQSLMFKVHQRRRSYQKGIQYFVCATEFVRHKLVEAGFDQERVITLPYFIDLSDLKLKTGDEGYVLYSGRLVEEKGVEVLIKAMEQLPGIQCKILGSGPDEQRLQEMARLVKNVEFLGWQEGGPAWELYRGARVVVVPSLWYEVFGLSALEAMAVGTPVIASDIGGLSEVVDDTKTGRLFPAGDVQTLRALIADMFDHPDAAKRMGEQARAKVEQQYSPDQHYQRIVEIYQQAISEKR